VGGKDKIGCGDGDGREREGSAAVGGRFASGEER
jgi:hypothetical protein